MAAHAFALTSLVVAAWSMPLASPPLSEAQLVISAEVQAGVLDIISKIDLDGRLVAIFDSASGDSGTFTTVADASPHRQLQSDAIQLQFKYRVRCTIDCDSITSTMENLRSDDAAGLAHAQSIIDAMNAVLVPYGLSGAIISSAADIAATISPPTLVAIHLPPAPDPCPAPPESRMGRNYAEGAVYVITDDAGGDIYADNDSKQITDGVLKAETAVGTEASVGIAGVDPEVTIDLNEIVSFEKPHTYVADGANLLTFTIEMKGSFRDLMLFSSSLEKQQLGKISSTSFIKKRNYRTRRNELFCTILLQKLSK